MNYAIEQLRNRARNYKQSHVLADFAKMMEMTADSLETGKHISVPHDIVAELIDVLKCVLNGLENGTKEKTAWRKRALKRASDLSEAIKFLRPDYDTIKAM